MASIVRIDLERAVKWQELDLARVRGSAKRQRIKGWQQLEYLSIESIVSIEIYGLPR
jgi:hypothetical protein